MAEGSFPKTNVAPGKKMKKVRLEDYLTISLRVASFRGRAVVVGRFKMV